jgi:hypothetical protein
MMTLESCQEPTGMVVLIHGRDEATIAALVSTFRSLASEEVKEVPIHQMPGVSPIGGCQVVATNEPGRRGVWNGSVRGAYRWSQDLEGWLQVAELAEPIGESTATPGARFQFLEQKGSAEIVLSTERAWRRRLTRACRGLAHRLRLFARR